jgi:preprotein translocase subunit Sss1
MDEIVEEIRHINKTLEGILAVMKRPENKIMQILEIAGAGVGILGIISIADIIRKWITGV